MKSLKSSQVIFLGHQQPNLDENVNNTNNSNSNNNNNNYNKKENDINKSNNNNLKLNTANGKEILIPILGIGTFKSKDIENIIRIAIDNGYRRIDTASMYGNEELIGKILKQIFREGKIKREDIFITSKCSYTEHADKCLEAFKESLRKLQLDYLDCYLIHWPGVYNLKGNDIENSVQRAKTWLVLQQLYQDKLVRSIGVSNYTISHLKELLSSPDTIIKPALNQVEFHPLNYQKELLSFCKDNNIVLESYASLAGGRLIHNENVIELSKQLGKTPSQLLLRWAIQKGVVVIPKSDNAHRLIENAMLFDFTIPDNIMESLDNLNCNKNFYMDPNTIA